MQLLPSTAKGLAKESGTRHFTANELFDPSTNLQLGTLDLRKSIDRYGGQVEYALAAYNAGDGPVRQWIASNDYKDVPEWVESIPYSETRDYVQEYSAQSRGLPGGVHEALTPARSLVGCKLKGTRRPRPDGEIGRHSGLKIRRPAMVVGVQVPPPGTIFSNDT